MSTQMTGHFWNSDPLLPFRGRQANPLRPFEITAVVSFTTLTTIGMLQIIDSLAPVDKSSLQKQNYNTTIVIATSLLAWSLFSLYVLKPKQR